MVVVATERQKYHVRIALQLPLESGYATAINTPAPSRRASARYSNPPNTAGGHTPPHEQLAEKPPPVRANSEPAVMMRKSSSSMKERARPSMANNLKVHGVPPKPPPTDDDALDTRRDRMSYPPAQPRKEDATIPPPGNMKYYANMQALTVPKMDIPPPLPKRSSNNTNNTNNNNRRATAPSLNSPFFLGH